MYQNYYIASQHSVRANFHFRASNEVDFVSSYERNGSSEFGIRNLGDKMTAKEPQSLRLYAFMCNITDKDDF